MTEPDATPGNKIARLPFGLTPLPYFIGVACTVAMLAYMSNILKYLSRPDLLNLQLTFFGLTMGPVTILSLLLYQRARTAGRKDLIRLVNFVILLWIGYYAFQLDWNPGQQLRQPAPYESWEIPTEPMAKQAYDLAHSIELPDPYVPDDFYKPGLFGVFGRTTRIAYFRHLCDTYAGETIYSTAENVDGIYDMRPRTEARETEHLSHRYRMEDPAGYNYMIAEYPHAVFTLEGRYRYLESTRVPYYFDAESPDSPEIALKTGRYGFLNVPQYENKKYWRFVYEILDETQRTSRSVDGFHVYQIDSLSSEYGYTWRGIRVPHGRENGIAGGEFIVVELNTGSVVAVRRSFVAASNIRNNQSGLNWDMGTRCPSLGREGRSGRFYFEFLRKALEPSKED